MQKEQSHLKITLFLIKDWDGFQKAMREIMMAGACLNQSTRGVCR